MYEVEVKAYLKNKKAVIVKLEGLGYKFSPEVHQVDHIFVPEEISFPPPLGVPVLRVRKQSDVCFFTLKISQGNRTDSIEREIEIKDGDRMIEILEFLKWKENILVDKKRIKAKFNDIEIVLDTVKNLGEFIEAEKIVKDKNHKNRENIQKDLFAFLETLGVKRKDHIVDGKYDIMLFEIYKKLGLLEIR